MKVQVNVLGVKEIIKSMEEKQNQMKQQLPEGVKDATLFLHGRIKSSIAHGDNAPVAVDTGRFLNSIDFMSAGNDGKIFTDLEYAKFLEYGTSKMSPRPHFKNTLFVNQEQLKKEFGVKIKQIFK